MAKCTRCGAKAGFMMSLGDPCIQATDAERKYPISARARVEAQSASIAPNGPSAVKRPPFTDSATAFLRSLGLAVGGIGVIGGLLTLANIPEASVLNTLYLAIGCAEIVSGVTTGAFLYVVAGIGDAVLDLWKAQQDGKTAVPLKGAI